MPHNGEVFDDRFTIEHLAGAGGMGQVYQARDRNSGGLVALKVMHDADKLEIERFAREAQVLATLSHPGIVRYIDSGTTADGDPYLVMEWLSGETLAARLQRTHITLSESLALGRRVASALGALHRRGVVHRDIKPSNLFLRNGVIEEVALIDFGMARRPVADPKLTVTGTMLGTPGYVAPEQVYNVPNLDGRADIFSLGCVLYRCLAGRVPFRGPDALRMLLNGAPDQLQRLRDLRPSIPRELDDLVARMLSKSPDDRPHSGDGVAAELLAIEENEQSPLSARSGPRSVVSEIMASERRLMCLVAARTPERMLLVMEKKEQERALHGVVERYRGRLEIFSGGSLLVILSNADAATDLAARAARCALEIQRLLDNSAVSVVSGREVLGSRMPESELLDRAVDQLRSTAKGAAVRVDELTSALLKGRFDTDRTGHHLLGERREPGRARLVFGEPVAFVGRDQELTQLETIFEQCTEERAASMVLLTGAAGVGKSRLAHELLQRVVARSQDLEIWFGEADALDAGTAFALLAQVLGNVFGFVAGEPMDAQREKIRARVARHDRDGDPRLAELLGEIAGAPFQGRVNGELGAPPGELSPSSEQMEQAFLRLLGAACAVRPVVLVLENLHWGDLPTHKLITTALGELSDQPLLVLALARTEVHEIFPQLRADRHVQEIRLHKLPRRASEQMVRQVLGDAVEEEAQKALVERSEGHASYLEEMIRAAARGKGTATPETVLAMVQARIEKLDPSARRVLRAASIFGETFWRAGVEALLGGRDTAAWLAELMEQDWIVAREGGRFPAEREFRFRQTLVWEAAYGMLTEGDRVAGHWLAGQWLEEAGETDAKILADHFERCGRGG
jgi:serine/threonine protein kinase